MQITRSHRRGATSLLVLALAGLSPGLAQGEVATAQIVPEPAPVLQQATIEPAPAVEELKVEAEEPKLQAEVEDENEKETPKPKILDEGIASYYGAELAGNKTANGERFNPAALTAAHRTLPMGTKLKVTNKANGKSVIVRINDRGPFAKNRIIDVSKGAAERISMVRSGTARVVIERIS